jgi:dihydroorotase
LIRGGRVVDPSRGTDGILDVLVEEGVISEVGPRVQPRGATVVEVKGLVVCPGFVDLRARLGEPGHEERETVKAGTRAAAAGGFTSVCVLPDTDPVNDREGVTRTILDRARAEGIVRVLPLGAVTRGLEGVELAEYGDLKDAGCVGLSSADRSLSSARVLRRALEYARVFDLLIFEHCEEPSLGEKAVMNEGPVATMLGLRGTPAAAEALYAERSALLAELTGGRVHLSHLSTGEGVEVVRRAKARGVRLTADVTPHHLLMTDEAVREKEYDTATKLRPPLRSEADRLSLVQGLRDGTVDCIATDHAPLTVDDKRVEFDAAGFGASALETAVAACLDGLVAEGVVTLDHLVRLLSTNPARVLGLQAGTLAPGAPADITILDLSRKRQVDPARFESRGRYTPLAGAILRGWPAMTIVGGRIVWKDARG